VAANLLAAEAPDAGGKCFNVATGEAQSLNDLVRLLNDLMGTNVQAEHGPPRAGDVEHSLADITQAREVLGYEPAVAFEEGLRMTIESFGSDPGAPPPAQ
jgi:UDP-glucose 4-epimerase